MHTMASGLLSLKWNNHRSTFFHVLSSIRSKESYCDATLACDGRFYPVHKLVLSTCSEYFEQIFERTQCKHPVIVLKDIKYDDLEALMNYMYVGEVNVLQERLAGLIKAAECLKIKGLAVPDEDPSSSKERRNQSRDFDSPHAKRRRRDESASYDDRDRPVSSRTSRLGHREPQISHTDPLLPENSAVGNALSESVTQDLENEPECANTDPRTHESKSRSSSSHRSSSHKQIHEVNIDEGSVKTEPPDIPDDVPDNKETLHSDLGLDPGTEGESLSAGPASVASGSNDAGYSDSNALESAPQSVEDVVAQALPPTSSNFQGGNSFPLWEGEGNMQNFPGEGYSGESNQGRPMVEIPLSRRDQVKKEEDSSGGTVKTPLPRHDVASNSFSSRLSSPSPPPVQRSSSASPSSLHSNASLHSPPNDASSSTLPTSAPSLSHSIQSFLSSSSSFSPPKSASSSTPLFGRGEHSGQTNFSQSQMSPSRGRIAMPCTICSKVFPTPTSLKVHIRTHTGEKPFSCQYCLYRTAQKGNLATHMRTHTGEKPFACSQCSGRFKSGSALTGHIRSKH